MQLVNGKTSMCMAILDYSQLTYIRVYIYKIIISPKTPCWLAKNRAKARPSIWRALSQCPICYSWVSSKLKKGALPPTKQYLQRFLTKTNQEPEELSLRCFYGVVVFLELVLLDFSSSLRTSYSHKDFVVWEQ